MYWQFRRWVDNPTNEEPKVGEPYWDTARNRFGVATANNIIRWFLRSTNNGIRLNSDQNLSGMVSDSVENTVVLDFSNPGEIRVVDKGNNNNILARFTSNGTLFQNASVSGTVQFGGIVNQIINGNLALDRDIIKTSTISDSTTNSAMVAPNWQLWRSSVNGGSLTASTITSDNPPGCSRAIQLVVNLPCYAGGLRTFIHSVSQFAGKKGVFSVYIKGGVGNTAKVRVLTDISTLAIVPVTANGTWQRITIPYDFSLNPLDASATVLAFDALYAPIVGTAQAPWKIGGAQFNFGVGVLDLEPRSKEFEKSLANGIYRHVKQYVSNINSYVSWDLLSGSLFAETDNSGVNVTEVESGGAVLSKVNSSSTTVIKTQVCAYRFPVISESN